MTDAAVTPLSELEGAVLSELHHRGRQTAFKVRRSFATSPSLEWRGSAGAVYAAIARLERSGLISGEMQQDARGTRILAITDSGAEAMLAWACDSSRAISVGVDPFRLRSGIWAGLSPAMRTQLTRQLKQALLADLDQLKSHKRHDDLIERASVELAIKLQETRLTWLTRLARSDAWADGQA